MAGSSGNSLFTFVRTHWVQQWLPCDLREWFSLCSGGRVLCTVVLRGRMACLPALEQVQRVPRALGEIIRWLSKIAF